jgi:hypothetical protein
MSRNGLRQIRCDDDTQFTSTLVEFHVVDLPPVVSPAKPISHNDEEGVVENPPSLFQLFFRLKKKKK